MPLQFERADNLNELPPGCASRQMITQPRQLHGDGRSAAMPPARSPAEDRPHQCDWVNSRMMPIVFVFKLKRRIDQRGRNVWQRSPDPKFLIDRKSTRLNSSHANISYAVFCLKKKKKKNRKHKNEKRRAQNNAVK